MECCCCQMREKEKVGYLFYFLFFSWMTGICTKWKSFWPAKFCFPDTSVCNCHRLKQDSQPRPKHGYGSSERLSLVLRFTYLKRRTKMPVLFVVVYQPAAGAQSPPSDFSNIGLTGLTSHYWSFNIYVDSKKCLFSEYVFVSRFLLITPSICFWLIKVEHVSVFPQSPR